MKFIDELRATKNQQPFVPFEILVSDGQRYPIHHPDAVAWDDESKPSVLVLLPKGQPSVKLRVAQVTGITELPPQPQPPKAKPKRRGK